MGGERSGSVRACPVTCLHLQGQPSGFRAQSLLKGRRRKRRRRRRRSSSSSRRRRRSSSR
eukprot:4113227-Pyramimonas_sp.AAC.1